MNKAELIGSIAEKTGFTKTDCGKILEATLDSIIESVSAGDDVKLVGFGNFEVKNRAARQGRNPKDGTVVQIPAKKAVGFKAGKAFKDAVNA